MRLRSRIVSTVRKKGWTLVLGTSGKKDDVVRNKKLLQIKGLTDLEISADDVRRSKPHPDIFEFALKKLDGIGTEQILAVGDTPYDVQAGRQLEIRTIALLSGGFSEPELRAAGAVAVFRGPAELLYRYEDWAALV